MLSNRHHHAYHHQIKLLILIFCQKQFQTILHLLYNTMYKLFEMLIDLNFGSTAKLVFNAVFFSTKQMSPSYMVH